MKLKVGEVIKIRNNYFKVSVGNNKPSCVRCWFLAGMRWCCLDGTSKNHYININNCKKLIDIHEGQYFDIVPSNIKEGI